MNPPPELAPPDRNLPWMPDHFVPLAYSTLWSEVPELLRLRINQWQACLHLELVVFFETNLRPALETLATDASLPASSRTQAREMAEEEAVHSAVFLRHLEGSQPSFYGRGERLAHLPGPFVSLLRGLARRPRSWPLFLLLQVVQEERLMSFGRRCLGLAKLDPAFRDIQRWHLVDEAGHVPAAATLFHELWGQASGISRKVNARLFVWLISNCFLWPGRSSRRVLHKACKENPAFASWEKRLLPELARLRQNRIYLATLYPLDELPRFGRVLLACPEFQPGSLSPWLTPATAP